MKLKLFIITILIVSAINGIGQELFENGKNLELVTIDSCKLNSSSIVKTIYDKLSFDYTKDQINSVDNTLKIRLSFKVLVPYMNVQIPNEVFYDLVLDAKDNKYRLTMKNFELVSQGIQKLDFYVVYSSAKTKVKLIYKDETYKEQKRIIEYIKNNLSDTKKTSEWYGR